VRYYICIFFTNRLILDLVSGQQLRQDDPSALKDIILMLQPAIASVGEANLSVRTKFMIETINDLKNNRLKTGITASAVKSQHTVHMRKILRSLNMRTTRTSEPLGLSLNDIREADRKGKWWLVGASWKNGSEGVHGLVPLKQPSNQDCTASAEAEVGGTTDLIQLAGEQRMNTDVRRAIFITIMRASDYLDAHEQLLKLRLNRAQELEIPRVLIHCAGTEQAYNPYYALIAKRLCRQHRLKMAFQFGLWDLFKRMGEGDDEQHGSVGTEMDEEVEHQELGTRKLVNMAKMFGNLIVDGSLGLSVLKVSGVDTRRC
jgi:nucleolar MIF4G domain-containing protein 1